MKSRKLWLFIASFVAATALAAFGKFDATIAAFFVGLPAAYGFVNVRDKRVECSACHPLETKAS